MLQYSYVLAYAAWNFPGLAPNQKPEEPDVESSDCVTQHLCCALAAYNSRVALANRQVLEFPDGNRALVVHTRPKMT
jgi:hypothetical protein